MPTYIVPTNYTVASVYKPTCTIGPMYRSIYHLCDLLEENLRSVLGVTTSLPQMTKGCQCWYRCKW